MYTIQCIHWWRFVREPITKTSTHSFKLSKGSTAVKNHCHRTKDAAPLTEPSRDPTSLQAESLHCWGTYDCLKYQQHVSTVSIVLCYRVALLHEVADEVTAAPLQRTEKEKKEMKMVLKPDRSQRNTFIWFLQAIFGSKDFPAIKPFSRITYQHSYSFLILGTRTRLTSLL